MTIDTIETARQAGFVLEGDLSGAGRLPMLLEHFAALVRAQVLEEAAQVCEQWGAWNNVAQECAGAIRGMTDSGHSTARAGEASTTPAPGWIPASERLPLEDDGEVLVRMRDGRCEIAWATYWRGASNDFAGWSFRDPDEDEAPTHWMPLPPAPTGADTGRHGSDGPDESASPSVLLIRGEK